MREDNKRPASMARATGLRWATATMLCISVAACGGGGGASGGDSEQQGDLSVRHYLPAAAGDRWFYTDSDIATSVVVKATGPGTVDGQAGVIVQSNDGTGEVLLVETAQGVRQVPTANSDPFTAAVGPVQLLRYPLHVGDSHTAASVSLGAMFDFDGDGRGDTTSLKSDVQVVEQGPLTTGLGTMADCLHVRTTTVYTIQLSSQNRTATLTQTANDWLAPGIGLVRSLRTVAVDGQSDSYTHELTAYGVGSLRSESVSPSATAPGLTGSATLGPATAVQVDFDEDMDQDTLATALRVTDSAGQPVSGTVTVGARTIRFTPTTPWATGSFSAHLDATATDLVGNPAAASAWNFTIDATPPEVTGTQPLEGAVDVPLASAIVLQFSEPVLESTVNASTVMVLYDGAVLTDMSYQVAGNQVTLTPSTTLARGKPYTISLSGVTDFAGNPVTATQLHFTTDPGRFGAPVPLPKPAEGASVGSAVAVGDVNGDGRPDVVASVVLFLDGQWQNQLAVYAQQGDGSLAQPVLMPLQAGAQALAIAIGDLNGDGLNDVAVGEASLGVQIFRQTADGQLAADRVVATDGAAFVRLADMNRDGRLDIVSFGGNVVSVWLNLASGWAVNDAVTVTSYPAAWDLAVGDINGDGRPDIVFTSEFLPGYAAAGILKQAADGHLASAEWLMDGDNHETSFNLAVGDVDGDGRDDIVLSMSTGLRLTLQRADGTLAPMTMIDGTFFPGTPKVADINADGLADVVTVDGLGNLTVLLQQAGGTWAASAVYPGNFLGSPPSSTGMAVADINGDGRLDIVAAGDRFIQRPVAMNSQSVRPARPTAASGTTLRRMQAALRGATRAR